MTPEPPPAPHGDNTSHNTDTLALNDIHAILTTPAPPPPADALQDITAVLARTGRLLFPSRLITAATGPDPHGLPVARIDAEGTTITIGQVPNAPGLQITITPRDKADEDALLIALATLSRSLLRRARPDFTDRSAAPGTVPVRVTDPVQPEAVRIPDSVQEPGVWIHEPIPDPDVRAPEPAYGDPVQPARTDASTGLPDADPHDVDGDGDRRDPHVDRNAVVADQIRDAARARDRWQPDYAALMAATGRKRSWCEKVVHDARTAVLEVLAPTDDAEVRAEVVHTDEPRTDDLHTDDTRMSGETRTATAPHSSGVIATTMPGAGTRQSREVRL